MYEIRRYHIFRQAMPQFALQGFSVKLFLCRVISAQSLASIHVLNIHHSLGYSLTLCQRCLDFTNFDSESTELNLSIDPVGVNQFAILIPPYEVASAIHQVVVFFIRERILDESFSSEFRPVPISTRNLRTRKIQLTDTTSWKETETVVKDVGTQIGQWTTYRDAVILFLRIQFSKYREYCKLRWSISIKEPCVSLGNTIKTLSSQCNMFHGKLIVFHHFHSKTSSEKCSRYSVFLNIFINQGRLLDHYF